MKWLWYFYQRPSAKVRFNEGYKFGMRRLIEIKANPNFIWDNMHHYILDYPSTHPFDLGMTAALKDYEQIKGAIK